MSSRWAPRPSPPADPGIGGTGDGRGGRRRRIGGGRHAGLSHTGDSRAGRYLGGPASQGDRGGRHPHQRSPGPDYQDVRRRRPGGPGDLVEDRDRHGGLWRGPRPRRHGTAGSRDEVEPGQVAGAAGGGEGPGGRRPADPRCHDRRGRQGAPADRRRRAGTARRPFRPGRQRQRRGPPLRHRRQRQCRAPPLRPGHQRHRQGPPLRHRRQRQRRGPASSAVPGRGPAAADPDGRDQGRRPGRQRQRGSSRPRLRRPAARLPRRRFTRERFTRRRFTRRRGRHEARHAAHQPAGRHSRRSERPAESRRAHRQA